MQSLATTEPLRPMLKEMEDYGAGAEAELARLNNPFAERLVALSKQLGSAVRNESAVARARSLSSGRRSGQGILKLATNSRYLLTS